jgi:hypothetical protein
VTTGLPNRLSPKVFLGMAGGCTPAILLKPFVGKVNAKPKPLRYSPKQRSGMAEVENRKGIVHLSIGLTASVA